MSDVNDFPAICDSCCGPDKHIKMIRQVNGEKCKICTRPFTVYRWNSSDPSNKSKKTIICTTCARSRNCCQSCMLDINFGIPLEIRDAALKMAGLDKSLGLVTSISKQSRNSEVKAIMADKQQERFNNEDNEDGSDSNQREVAREILTKLAEKLKDDAGRPEFMKKKSVSKKDEISNIKSVDISKILSKLPFGGSIQIPENSANLTSFFLFGISDGIPQYLISNCCNQFGKIRSLTIIHRAKCGYVTFITRKSAEAFANSIMENGLNNNKSTPGILLLDNKFPIRVCWGKPKPLGKNNEEHHKLSLVVNKVMKQLAEKDKAFESSKNSERNSHNDNKGRSLSYQSEENNKSKKTIPPPLSTKAKYKATKADFEL